MIMLMKMEHFYQPTKQNEWTNEWNEKVNDEMIDIHPID